MSARPRWDFEYRALAATPRAARALHVVVAMRAPVPVAALAAAVEADVEELLDRAPLHWYRLSAPDLRPDLARRLAAFPVRYVTSAVMGDPALGEPAAWRNAKPARPSAEWRVRKARARAQEPAIGARWYLGERGVAVDRALCGTGAGARLAVIDDDARDADLLPLDAEVLVGIPRVPRASLHGSILAAWAVGTTRSLDDPHVAFDGVAPDASLRLYLIPRPEDDVVSLPLAIVRAVDDGADVVVCSTYVEGFNGPLFDDAVEFSARLGRGGKGALMVMPSGRQASSPHDSLHASWTAPLADPQCDPRVLCVGPSGRDGGWFLWADRKRRLRPFANRGPTVRCLAPGDDMIFPFETRERTFHCESSGAAAIAGGVAALVLAENPGLRADRLTQLLLRTCRSAAPPPEATFADACDLLPRGRDPDGHDAKHGYGVLDATRASAAGQDPLAFALVTIGEPELAARWAKLRRGPLRGIYTRRLGRWIVRQALRRPEVDEALRVLARHTRLVAGRASRQTEPGALVRRITLLLRSLSPGAPERIARDLVALELRLAGAHVEATLLSVAERLTITTQGDAATLGGERIDA